MIFGPSKLVSVLAVSALATSAWASPAAARPHHHNHGHHAGIGAVSADGNQAGNTSPHIGAAIAHFISAIQLEQLADQNFDVLVAHSAEVDPTWALVHDELVAALNESDAAVAGGELSRLDGNIVAVRVVEARDLDAKAEMITHDIKFDPRVDQLIQQAIVKKRLAIDVLNEARTPIQRKGPKPNGRSGGGRTGPMEMLCSAIPNPAMLSLNGSFAASVRCTGLPAAIFVDASSTGLLSACKGGVDFNGATPPIVVGADARGQAQFSVAGGGCVPGTYPIIVTEGGGSFQSFVAPLTLTFPLNGG
ncbi:MAG TPA: hypothetical protein VNY84_06630 [Acidimicrobiales bacterium]|nr:hypothetical protein [Acidimicrobiales bacterium]